ncbi:hypothetical protein DFS33DRAFT_153031 [Desarmillaria ectypa]|nr:hypothetical protein DFS33DRAFT_153031 [Desarmillaria ectypa]
MYLYSPTSRALQSIAAEPRMLLLLSSTQLQKVELSVGLDADHPAVFVAVKVAIAGRETFIVSCPNPVDLTVPCDAALFIGKSLRCLKILDYRVVDAFLEELSSSESPQTPPNYLLPTDVQGNTDWVSFPEIPSRHWPGSIDELRPQTHRPQQTRVLYSHRQHLWAELPVHIPGHACFPPGSSRTLRLEYARIIVDISQLVY